MADAGLSHADAAGSSGSANMQFISSSFAAASSASSVLMDHSATEENGSAANWLFVSTLLLVGGITCLTFWAKGDNYRLNTKLIALVVSLLLVLVSVSVVSVSSMFSIGDELKEIAEEDIPLSVVVASITAHQLEQSIWLERAALASGVDRQDQQRVDQATREFRRLSALVDTELQEGEHIAEQGESRADNIKASQEYKSVLSMLNKIEKQHADFNRDGEGFFKLVDDSQFSEALEMLAKVEEEEDVLNHELESLEAEVGAFTEASARTAELHEKQAVVSISLVSGIGLVLGILLSLIILKSIMRQLSSDPSELVVLADSLAEGNLWVEGSRSSTIGVYGAISRTIQKLTDIVRNIDVASSEVTNASNQVSQGNQDLSARTQEQASSLEEIAASMEEFSSTITQNAENAQSVKKAVDSTAEMAANGSDVVKRAVEAMKEISEASAKIANIIGVIDEIAFQTNLLALNAAVEAARAGDQGRGFAVVAQEVRQLAGRSATSAKEIKDLIQDSVGKVEDGRKLVSESGTTLNEIMTSVKDVSALVAEIAAASSQQSSSILQVNDALTQIDDVTQQNAALVEEAAAASENAGAQAEELQDLIGYFKFQDSGRSVTRVERQAVERLTSRRV